MGLRYELEGRFDRSFQPERERLRLQCRPANSGAARVNYQRATTPEVPVDQFNIVGGLLFPGVNGAGRGLYETPKRNFMPRFGFAYKLTEKTVVRGGYGIFFGFLGQRRGDVNQIGFGTNTNTNLVRDANGLPSGGQLLFQAFQGRTLNQAQGAGDGIRTFLGQTIGFFNQNPLSPYNQRYELSFQRELPYGWVAEVAYVGNRGTHIEIGRNLNAIPLQFLSTSPTRDDVRNNYLTANIRNPFINTDNSRLLPSNAIGDLSGANVQRQRLLRQFPQFNDVNTTTNDGYSWYHSLQVNMDKRFSRGYTLGANYTYSRFMEAISYLNAPDPRPAEVVSDADRPHRFSLSGIYELPFGKGRKFFADTNKVASYVISGWQIATVYQFQSGAPIGFGNAIYNGDLRNIALSGDAQSPQRFFDPTGFVAARTSNSTNDSAIFGLATGQVVWLDFNDPCKTRYSPTACPGTPLVNPQGFNRDGRFQLTNNVRTMPARFSFLRSDQINNVDFSVIKKTEILENKNIEFRAELLNAFNHVLFPGPNTDVTSSSFGQVVTSTQANYSRRVQLTLKFVF